MRGIYTDEETLSLEREILKTNPNFNFSLLYKEALKEYHNKTNCQKDSILIQLNSKLNEIEGKIMQLRSEKDYTEKKIKELVIQCEKEELENKEKERNNKKLINERIKNSIDKIKFYFDVEDEDKILSLADDFVNNFFKDISIFQFMNNKGFKQKEIEVKLKAPNNKTKSSPINNLFEEFKEDLVETQEEYLKQQEELKKQ